MTSNGKPQKPTGSAKKSQNKGAEFIEKMAAIKVPAFVKKIPLPILGGIVGFIGMVGYVVITAIIMPPPGAPRPVSSPPQQTSAAQTQAAAQSDTPPSGIAAELTYEGGKSIDAPDSGKLPLIKRYGYTYKELGRQVRMDQAAFHARAGEVLSKDTDPMSAFRIRIPSDWTRLDDRVILETSKLSQSLATYISPARANGRSRVTVKSDEIPYFIRIDDWLVGYARDKRLNIEAMSTYLDKDRAEAVYVTTEKETSYVTRMAAVGNGGRILVAEYTVPLADYEAEQDLQTWVISSFSPLYLVKETPEPLLNTSFYDLLSWSYPGSWQPQNAQMGDVRQMNMSLLLTQKDRGDIQKILGRIDIFAFARETITSDLYIDDAVNKWLALENVQMGRPFALTEVSDNPNGIKVLSSDIRNLLPIRGDTEPMEYVATTLQGDRYTVFVGLMVRSRDIDPANWARGQAAYDRVLTALREGRR